MINKTIGDKIKLSGGTFNIVNMTDLITPLEYIEELLCPICQFCGKQDVKQIVYNITKVFHLKNKNEIMYIGVSDCGKLLSLPNEKIALVYDSIFNK